MSEELIDKYECSHCANCACNSGISCPANGKGGIRVKCEKKGNVSPKVFCSEKE